MATRINAEQKSAIKNLVEALNDLDEMGAILPESFRERSQGIVVSFPVGDEDCKGEKQERYFIKKREGILDTIFSTESFRAKKQK